MMQLRNSIYLLLILALIAAPLAFLPQPAVAQVEYTCLPTCESNDGRFLSVAGVGLSTVADQPIVLIFGSPADAASLEIGIFDGNTGGQWDFGTTQVQFTLYADPILAGSTTTMVAQSDGSSMPDDDWFTITIPNIPEARSPSGNYFYRLEVTPLALLTNYWSNFKLRTTAVQMMFAQPFSYVAPLLTADDYPIIFPNYPTLDVTTYSGRFDFHVYMPSSLRSITFWDGDFDFGPNDLSAADTDDPNTPNDVNPPWAGANTVFEGIAQSPNGSTGFPSDDNLVNQFYRRSPNINYNVIIPDGRTYPNLDPTGNLEWERFVLSSDAALEPDHVVDGLIPSGLYNIHALGVDMTNLNAWKLPNVLGVCPVVVPGQDADPCKPPLFPFLIGDTVFRDPNGNGTQEDDETGIPGVVVHLLDSNDLPVNDIFGDPISAVTDADGMYFFNLPSVMADPVTGEVILDGTYSVRVGAENFNPGGPLAGMTSTTGGEQLTRTVIDDNVLTYDFGYRVPDEACVVTPGIWKTIWKDKWPVESITIAGVTYTREEAILLMSKSPKNDMTYQLFAQVVAAKLNVLNGNVSICIDADIERAETWLLAHPLGSGVIITSDAWRSIMHTFKMLDSYNKGKLCAGACVITIPPPTPLPPKPSMNGTNAPK